MIHYELVSDLGLLSLLLWIISYISTPFECGTISFHDITAAFIICFYLITWLSALALTYFVIHHNELWFELLNRSRLAFAHGLRHLVCHLGARLTKWVPRFYTGPTSSYTTYVANFSNLVLFTPLGRLLIDRLLWVGNHFTGLSSFSGHLFNKEFLPIFRQFAYRALPINIIEYSIVSCMRHYSGFVHRRMSPRLIKEYYATPSLSHCR